SHIWFFKGTPSRLGILLDMSPRNLERILYFALYLITHIDEHQRERVLQQIEEEAEGKIRRLEQTISDRTGAVESRASAEIMRIRADQDLSVVRQDIAPDVQIVRDESKSKREEVMSIKALEPKTEAEYRALADKYRFFRAQMGAEAVLEIMRQIDLPKLSLELQAEMRSTTGQRRKKSIKRLRLVKALLRSGASPEWMILTIL